MTTFCTTPLWDSNLTWFTADPDFTPCFHQTILVYIPTGFLWVFAYFDQFSNWNSTRRNCPWSWNNVSKLTITSMLALLCIIEIILFSLLTLNEEAFITGSDFVASGAKLISYLLCLILIWNAKKAGRTASAVQAIFWFLLVVCQGFTFGSVVNHELEGLDWSEANEIIVIVSWLLILANFIVYCFPDHPPTYVDIKGNKV